MQYCQHQSQNSIPFSCINVLTLSVDAKHKDILLIELSDLPAKIGLPVCCISKLNMARKIGKSKSLIISQQAYCLQKVTCRKVLIINAFVRQRLQNLDRKRTGLVYLKASDSAYNRAV